MSSPIGTVSVDNKEHGSVPKVDNSLHCPVFEQIFNQPGDLKRHKHLAGRFLPIEEPFNVYIVRMSAMAPQ